MFRSLLLRSWTALAAVAAVALPVAGCGATSSAGGDAGADPAASLPAHAPIYVEAQLHPQGDLKANVDAVGRKLLNTDDPAARITELVDNGLRGEGASFKADIEPWLGDRIGFALTGLGAGAGGGAAGHKGDGVAAIASKDDGRAQAFVDGRPNTETRSYRGVDYRYDAKRDTAAAVVGHVVLVGSERGFKSAVDATKGDALADAKAFKDARDAVSSTGIGFAYVDPARAVDLALGAVGGKGASQAQALASIVAGSGVRSIGASLEVAGDALRVDAAVLGLKVAAGNGDGPGAAAAVPADAWLSVGVGDVGGALQSAIDQIGRSGAIAGIDPATLLQQLKSGLGVDVQRDFLAWMGDAALFVRGTAKGDVNGALVVHSTDPAASQRAIDVLRRLLPQLGAKVATARGAGGAKGLRVPLGRNGADVEIAAQGDRFVIAMGPGALAAALGTGGGPTLGDSDNYKTAAGLLGGAKPSVFLDTPALVKLLGATVGDQAGFAKARPTLDAFGPAAAGVTRDGDTLRIKAAVAVR